MLADNIRVGRKLRVGGALLRDEQNLQERHSGAWGWRPHKSVAALALAQDSTGSIAKEALQG